MAKRKKKALPLRQPGFDGRMALSPTLVDDPMPVIEGEKRVVVRNFGVAPILLIFGRDRLRGPGETEDDAKARLEAGMRFRQLYERAEMGGSKAIDYSAVKVDVSFVYRDMPLSAGEAMQELARCSRALGHHYPVIHALAGEEMKFTDFADRATGRPAGGRDWLDVYQRVREALDALVSFWGVARGRSQGVPQDAYLSAAQTDLPARAAANRKWKAEQTALDKFPVESHE